MLCQTPSGIINFMPAGVIRISKFLTKYNTFIPSIVIRLESKLSDVNVLFESNISAKR